MKQLLKSCSPATKKKIFDLSKSYQEVPSCESSLIKDKKKRQRNDSLIKKKIVSFYDTIALNIPDKKFYSKRLKTQRKVLDRPIAQIYSDNILKMKSMKLRQCLCETCENMQLMFKPLRAAGSQYECVSDALKSTLCSYDGEWASLDCIQRKCNKCGTHSLKEELQSKCDLLAKVTYKSWDHVADERCKSKKTKLTSKNCLFDELISTFLFHMQIFSLHKFVDKWQRHQFNSLKKSLTSDCILNVLDFAENYTCQYQNQVQSAYYGLDQITIHPVVIYTHCSKCLNSKTTYRIYVSNDLKHDAHFANRVLTDTLQYLDSNSTFIIFSDNCCSQYKSRLPVYYFSKLAEKYNIERCFFGERHGKSECDSSGAVVKSFLSQSVASGRATLNNVQDIFQYLSDHFQLYDDFNKNCSHCSRLSRTFHLVLSDSVDRTITSAEIPLLKCIKKLHSFKFLSNGLLATRQLSCFFPQCLSGMHKQCTSENIPNFEEVQWFSRRKIGLRKRKVKCVIYDVTEEVSVDGRNIVDYEVGEDDIVDDDNVDENDNTVGCEIGKDDIVADFDEVESVVGCEVGEDDSVPDDDVDEDENVVGCEVDKDDNVLDDDVGESENVVCELGEDDDLADDNVDEDENVIGCEVGEDDNIADVDKDENTECCEAVEDETDAIDNSTGILIEKRTRRRLFCSTLIRSGKNLFRDFYLDLERCTSFQEMQAVCQRQKFEALLIKAKPIKINMDFEALKIAPPNTPLGYLPNVTIGDGNCVTRSLSTLVFGTDNHHLEIRCRIIHELVSNKPLYLDKDFLSEGCEIDSNSIISKIIALSEPPSGINLSDVERIFEAEVFDTRMLGRYLGPWHLHAAAQILKCGIVSLYPQLGPPQNRELMARAFLPLSIDYEDPLYILWTSCRKDMRKEHWVANHVVPLVKMFK